MWKAIFLQRYEIFDFYISELDDVTEVTEVFSSAAMDDLFSALGDVSLLVSSQMIIQQFFFNILWK